MATLQGQESGLSSARAIFGSGPLYDVLDLGMIIKVQNIF